MTADKGIDMLTTLDPRRGGRERGTALIEFTLVLPLLLVLTVAAVDFGRAFFTKNVLEQAAREGVRLRAVTSAVDTATVRARVLEVAQAGHITVSDLLVEGPNASRQVRVLVTGEFNPHEFSITVGYGWPLWS